MVIAGMKTVRRVNRHRGVIGKRLEAVGAHGRGLGRLLP
jgi:hypothetical protein